MAYVILAEGCDEQGVADLDRRLLAYASRSTRYVQALGRTQDLVAPPAVIPAASEAPTAPPASPPPPRPAANLEGAKALIAAFALPQK